MSDIEQRAADLEATNGSETVVRYGVGVVAFEERINGYVIRYEAEDVGQLLDLMDAIQRRQTEAKARKANQT